MTTSTNPPRLCACGCGEPLPPQRGYGRKPSRYIQGHNTKVPAVRQAQLAGIRATLERKRAGMPEPVYICQCGCGEVIPFKPFHRYKPPKYIRSHYLAMRDNARIRAAREGRKRSRMPPPADWVAPTGLCECGCGRRTPIAKTSKPDRGQYAGYPLRFLHGHNARLFTPEQTSGWKGGRYVDRAGYILLHLPEHPAATKYGYVPAHRFVYEQSRGVRLPKGVIVHHLNGNKSDNRPENLVALTRMEHKKAHALANSLISLFLDDKLLEAARAHVREHGTLPDLEALTAQVYSQPPTPPAE